MRMQPHRRRRRGSRGDGHEIHVVYGALAIAVDEVDQAAADSLDRGNVEFHRTGRSGPRLRSQFERAREGEARVGDAKCHGTRAGSVRAREFLRKAVVFRIDDEIDIALVVQGHVLRPMPRNRRQPHALEQPPQ